MRLASRSTVVAICLAIFALASAASSARPFEPIPPVQQVHIAPATPQVHPNPDQQSVVVHHAVAIPPVLKPVKPSQLAAAELAKAHALADSRPTGAYGAAALAGYGSVHPVSVQAPQAPSANPDNGFDWGDAAIGAAAGLSLTLLVLGGALVLSHRRSRTGESAEIATT